MITLENVNKIYSNGLHAVKDVNLKVNEGDIFGIIGLSGAGKSSLIRLINRLEEPTSGRIFINGEDILSLNKTQLLERRKKIGMIFQHFNLLSSRTVEENVAFALEIANWNKRDIGKRVAELLEIVGLSDKVKYYPSQLSGGQKQRVSIARALANNPDILLSDEATSALDPKTTKSILELIKEIQEKIFKVCGYTKVADAYDATDMFENCDFSDEAINKAIDALKELKAMSEEYNKTNSLV